MAGSGRAKSSRAGGLPGSDALLGLLEPGWRRDLAAGSRAADLDVEADLLRAAARALGDQARRRSPAEVAREWPACVVVTLARVASGHQEAGGPGGSFWPGWHRAAGLRMTRRSAAEWSQAFLAALDQLGLAPVPAHDPPAHERAAHERAAHERAAHERAAHEPPAESAARHLDAARDAILAHARPQPDQDAPPAADEARPRLDPFGLGVLLAGRPALPEQVTDPADPLLVFDQNGEHVGPDLPAEPVWVLHPADAQLRCDVAPRVVVTSRLPLTWHRWRLVQLDLRGVSWLALETADPDDDAAAPPRHRVRGRDRPWLITGPPVPGVSTRTGDPVFPRPPDVLLPPGPARWRAEVRRAGTDVVLGSLTAAGDGWQPGRLWQAVTRPVLGELTVAVTAADAAAGPGLRRSVTVAEGLAASYFPAPRLTGDRGLEPAEATLAAPPGMTVSPQAVPVPAGAVTVEVTCIAATVLQRLRVTPPHVRIRIEPEPGSAETPTRWHHAGPLPLETTGLWRGGALSLSLPGIGRNPPVEVVGPDNEVVQVLEPTRTGRYPLRRMADTAAALGGASLRITVGGRTATIARITMPDGQSDPWLKQDG
ncbi:MAG TPA: hypothetical protein VFO01_09065 [Trebonia sp.]|nr:hypothetical protein [Trebonia sp.]